MREEIFSVIEEAIFTLSLSVSLLLGSERASERASEREREGGWERERARGGTAGECARETTCGDKKYIYAHGEQRAAPARKLRACRVSGARLSPAVTAVCGTLRAQPCGRALTRTDRAAGAGKRLGCCREQAPRARSDGALWALGPHDWIFR